MLRGMRHTPATIVSLLRLVDLVVAKFRRNIGRDEGLNLRLLMVPTGQYARYDI